MVRGRARGGAKLDLAPCARRRQTNPVYLLYALLLCVVSFLCATAAVVLLLRYVHIVSCETVLVCILMLLLLLQISVLFWAGCYCAFRGAGWAYSFVARLSHLTVDHASFSRPGGGVPLAVVIHCKHVHGMRYGITRITVRHQIESHRQRRANLQRGSICICRMPKVLREQPQSLSIKRLRVFRNTLGGRDVGQAPGLNAAPRCVETSRSGLQPYFSKP